MNREQKEAVMDLFSLLSFMFFIVSGLAIGAIGMANHILPAIGVDMEAKLSGLDILIFLGCGGLAIVVFIYLSVFVWLIFAKYFLNSNSVWRVAKLGPITKWDRWLLQKLIGFEPKVY